MLEEFKTELASVTEQIAKLGPKIEQDKANLYRLDGIAAYLKAKIQAVEASQGVAEKPADTSEASN